MYFSLVSYFFAFCLACNVWAFSTTEQPAINLNPLVVEKIEVEAVNKTELTPGEQATIKLKINLDEGFHAYLDQFKLKLIGPDQFYISEPHISPTVKFTDPISKKTKIGAEKYFEIVSLLDIPTGLSPGTHQLELQLTYQACGKDFCLLPKQLPLVHKINVGQARPTTLTGAMDRGWFYALFFVFIAGVLTSFTPCIFPMIPITLAVIGSRGERSKWRGFVVSSFYVLGIAFTYSALGLFAARSGTLFGSYLGHPIVVGLIALIFTLMALSMFGLFEIRAPHFITQKLAGIHTKKNLFGAFISGLTAGVVASPCVGPVLVGILTYVAQTQNLFKGFVLLFTFAIGLGQIFLVLGTFHTLIHKIPKSGPWMDHIKKIFGIVMLGMALYYVYPLVKKPIAEIQQKYLGFTFTPEENFAKPAWVPYSDEALAQALVEKRPVIIDFYADWCVACKELEKYTFSDPRVLELGQKFLWLKFDATEPSETMDRLQIKYGIGGLPFIVLYNTNGVARPEDYLTGFEKADAFLQRMQRVNLPE